MLESIVENETKIREKIKNAFRDSIDSEKDADGIGFHMTDWLKDLQEIVELYENIENTTNDEIRSFIYRFLAHVPNHLNAAMKLSGMGRVEDVFNVGIFEDDK